MGLIQGIKSYFTPEEKWEKGDTVYGSQGSEYTVSEVENGRATIDGKSGLSRSYGTQKSLENEGFHK